MSVPVVNEEECIGCGNCVDACPNDVVVMENGIAKTAAPDECIECGQCVEDCPVGAIAV